MKSKRTRAAATLASVAMLGGVTVSHADEDESGRWYFMPQAGGIYTDDERGVESSDVLAGIAIGRHLSARWSLELNANGASLSADAGPALDLYGVSLDALRVFHRERSFAPYLTFGAGALRSAPAQGSSDTDPMAEVGAGIQWRLGTNRRDTGTFSLRPEIKARWSDSSAGGMLDYFGYVGFQFSFGASRAADNAPGPAPRVSDTATSSQAAPEVQAAARPMPEAAAPSAPEPKPAQTIIVLPVVWFGVDSATLTTEARAALDRLAETLRSRPDLRIELQGHTDSTGGEQRNLALSIRRAEAARDHLLRVGVPAAQVSTRGFGETRPVAENDTAEGRARNRRVEAAAQDPPSDLVIRREQQE